MININIQNKGNITVFDSDAVIYKMIRKTPIPFFKTIGEIFQGEKKIADLHFHFIRKKIISQNFLYTIEIVNQKIFSSVFKVNDNFIKVSHNPFFMFNKKIFCDIYFNSEVIAIVSLKSVIDTNGYNLELKFLKKDQFIEYNCLLCFLIYSIEFNMNL